jgi:hypothetical protein
VPQFSDLMVVLDLAADRIDELHSPEGAGVLARLHRELQDAADHGATPDALADLLGLWAGTRGAAVGFTSAEPGVITVTVRL